MKVSSITLRRIHGEIGKLKTELPLYTKGFYVNDNDPYNMYFLVEPKTEPYTGEYILHVKLPAEYPMDAPQIEMLTPNGRFIPNKWICATFSHFHPESHNCVVSISTLVCMSVTYMLDDSLSGIGVVANQSVADKEYFAKQSRTNNLTIMQQRGIIFE